MRGCCGRVSPSQNERGPLAEGDRVMPQTGGVHSRGWGRRRMAAKKERNLEDKVAKSWPDIQHRPEPEQSREQAERTARSGLAEGREGGLDSLRWPSVPNPVPQPWASAQALCLLHGRPQHRAASGPVFPGWSQGPGGPLLRSTQPPPRPGRKLQGQELALPRLAHWPCCPLGPPAQLAQPPPGTAGTEEGPKRQTLLPVSTCSPSPQQGT